MSYQPQFSVSPRLLALIGEISVLRERVLSSAVQVPWVPALQKDARERTTHGSTSIEGNPLGLAEVRMLDEGKPVLSADEKSRREVLNHLAALRQIEKWERKSRIAHDDVLRLHETVMRGVLAGELSGRYRPFGVRVGTHIAPGAEKVHALMTDLLGWVNGESRAWSPVVSSAVVHFRFEDIHPFADGNGRTGRLLALWELYRRGFDTLHIFSVDEYYWEHRPAYYRAFEEVRRGDGDLTGWIEFAATAVKATLEDVTKRTAGLSARAKGATLVLRPRQERLLELLREKKSLSPAEIWAALGVSRQGALDLVRPLIAAGLVKRIGTRKSGKYVIP
ncbi:MAG: Fic family protein [Candidatus Coatesbacteria bacterium]